MKIIKFLKVSYFTVLTTLLIISISGIVSIVRAQQPSPQKDFTLTVDGKDIELISEALATLPYGKVAPLFAKLQKQLYAQQVPVPMPTNPSGVKSAE